MNSFISTLLITSALLAATCVGAIADDHSDIVALYAKLEHAMKAQSAEQVLALLAPDFKYTDRKGEIQNGKQFSHQIEVQKAEIVAVKKMKMKVVKVAITGNTAKVTNEFSWEMEIEDKTGQMKIKGKHHIMASEGVVENDLEKTPSGWRFLTLKTVNGKMTMDGKPLERHTPAPPRQSGK